MHKVKNDFKDYEVDFICIATIAYILALADPHLSEFKVC